MDARQWLAYLPWLTPLCKWYIMFIYSCYGSQLGGKFMWNITKINLYWSWMVPFFFLSGFGSLVEWMDCLVIYSLHCLSYYLATVLAIIYLHFRVIRTKHALSCETRSKELAVHTFISSEITTTNNTLQNYLKILPQLKPIICSWCLQYVAI